MEIEVIWAVLVAMVFQTVVLAAVNKSQLADLKEHLRDVRGVADRAHHRIDGLKDKLFEYLRTCKKQS